MFTYSWTFLRPKLGSRSVVEHIADLGVEIGNDNAVEECVESHENERTDYDADDDLHGGVDIALTGLVLWLCNETARGKEKAATEVTAYVSYIRLLANCQESIIDCIGVSTLRHELLSAAHQGVQDHSVLIRAHRNLELFLSLEHLAYLRSCSPFTPILYRISGHL